MMQLKRHGRPGIRTNHIVQLAVLSLVLAMLAFQGCGGGHGTSPSPTSTVTNAVSTQTPTISGVTVTSITATSAVVSWTTDTGSDTLVAYGPSYLWYRYPNPAASGVTDNTCSSTCGVTSHSVSLTELVPGTIYFYVVRSRGFTNGTPDQAKMQYLSGGTITFTTSAVPVTGSVGHIFDVIAGQNVVQGYDFYIGFRLRLNQMRATGDSEAMLITLSGLPPNITVSAPDVGGICCPTDTWDGTTLRTRIDSATSAETLKLQTSPSTPLGNYTITVNAIGSSSGIQHQKTFTLTVFTPTFSAGTPTSYPTIPKMATWESWMTTYGNKWSNPATPAGSRCLDKFWSESAEFYDGEWAYYQIADYDAAHGLTGNPNQWIAASQNCEHFYRDIYANAQIPPGNIPGYYVFTQGLYEDFIRTADAASKTALHNIAVNSANATLIGTSLDDVLQREIAQSLETKHWDTKLGNSQPQLARAVTTVIEQLDQIQNQTEFGYPYQPFMVGLQAKALIDYYEDGHQDDVRIPWAIKNIADWMWANAWVPPVPNTKNTGCFFYNSGFYAVGVDSTNLGNGAASEMRQLNPLVAPIYAWLFKMTGNARTSTTRLDPQGDTYQEIADEIWSNHFLGNPADMEGWVGKSFTQSYRWSFDFVKWRSVP